MEKQANKMQNTSLILSEELNKLSPKTISDCFKGDSLAKMYLNESRDKVQLFVETLMVTCFKFIGAELVFVQEVARYICEDYYNLTLADLKLICDRIKKKEYYGKPNPNMILNVIDKYWSERLQVAENRSIDQSQSRKEGLRPAEDHFDKMRQKDSVPIKKVIHEHIHKSEKKSKL